MGKKHFLFFIVIIGQDPLYAANPFEWLKEWYQQRKAPLAQRKADSHLAEMDILYMQIQQDQIALDKFSLKRKDFDWSPSEKEYFNRLYDKIQSEKNILYDKIVRLENMKFDLRVDQVNRLKDWWLRWHKMLWG